MNNQSIAQELQGLNDLVVAARGIISSRIAAWYTNVARITELAIRSSGMRRS